MLSTFKYAEISDLQAKLLQIPYKDNHLSILLPNEIDGLHLLKENLKTLDLSSLSQQLKKAKVNLSFPKFTSDFKVMLNKALQLVSICL